MREIKDLVTVNDYCAGLGLSALHPLVSCVDLAEGTWPNRAGQRKVTAVRYHFYAVFLKQGEQCTIRYGRRNYDYQDGTLVFVGPGQVVNIEHVAPDFQPAGHALLFHPDLLHSSHLHRQMDRYSFFSYALSEALHMSQRERRIVLDCFDKIRYELSQGIDKHSKGLILSNIELFLNYCVRFYDRQFITRDTVNSGVVVQFESALHAYFQTGTAREHGVPTVNYFAEAQHLSPNYFGDLIKKETGRSAQEWIQAKIIEVAKAKIFDPDKAIGEIAYELGFKHPQHFSRFFKNKVGYAPNAYRNLN